MRIFVVNMSKTVENRHKSKQSEWIGVRVKVASV